MKLSASPNEIWPFLSRYIPLVPLVTDSLAPEYIELSEMLNPPIVASKATRSWTLTFSAVMDFATITEPSNPF